MGIPLFFNKQSIEKAKGDPPIVFIKQETEVVDVSSIMNRRSIRDVEKLVVPKDCPAVLLVQQNRVKTQTRVILPF